MSHAAKTSQPLVERSERRDGECFSRPLIVSEYQTTIVVHDSKWSRVAAFPKTDAGRAKADYPAGALNKCWNHDADN